MPKKQHFNFKYIVFLSLILSTLISNAQVKDLDTTITFYGIKLYNNHINGDFTKVDNHVLLTPKNCMKSCSGLVNYFNQVCENDYERVRAFYTFIGEFITYDHKKAENRKKITRQLAAKESLSSKKAICGDIAILFMELCKTANIPCEYVVGYTKSPLKFWKPKRKDLDHAWNSVKIDSSWYLIDATWGMKNNTKKSQCRLSINYLYFLSDPMFFIQDHLPADPNYQLMKSPIEFSYFKWGKLSSKSIYHSNFEFKETLNKRLLLKKNEAILESAIAAYEFNPKNKLIIGVMMFLHAEDLLDKKKQGKKKFTSEEYQHVLTVLIEAKKQFELLNGRNAKGASLYIQKKIDELKRKIEKLEKKKSKTVS